MVRRSCSVWFLSVPQRCVIPRPFCFYLRMFVLWSLRLSFSAGHKQRDRLQYKASPAWSAAPDSLAHWRGSLCSPEKNLKSSGCRKNSPSLRDHTFQISSSVSRESEHRWLWGIKVSSFWDSDPPKIRGALCKIQTNSKLWVCLCKDRSKSIDQRKELVPLLSH